ncbi:MAG: 2-succinyl-5-enolpyruvyl-6-hydroxy-3-cyclohexene-1-carboxylic-acid synthase [Myxococcales bacterium]|nr:2-succinyl-5-enolpyruvyl-6-hydroxy-3-cyclohexene-1-carboxylic-acid synthase [Myxococcales bacterium]
MTTAAIQTAWVDLIVASLADAGVTHVVLSPGSRSTPLALALARAPRLARRVVIDERSAGFVALGAARASGQPAALICTSGTAPAHYAPAVIEASLAGVPLIVVSADRPTALHGAGASQTIDQQRLFGGFVRRFDDLGVADGGAVALAAARRKVFQAVLAARGPSPGPAHLNVPLVKPLEPAPPVTAAEHAAVAEVARLIALPPPVAAPSRLRVADAALADAAARLAAAPRGVILATAASVARAADRAAVAALARATGYPIVAEAGSQLRFAPRADDVVVVEHGGLIAASPLGAALAPSLVLQLGGEPVAMAWPRLAADAARVIVADGGWPDGDSRADALLLGEVADTLTRLAAALPAPSAGWAAAWRDADRRVAAAMTAARAWPGPWGEPELLARVVAGLADGALLAIGNSLPIRVIDEVPATTADVRVLTQRGAAGIDGLIAGAAGAAWASGRPTTLVLGDVAFAHDVGSLATLAGLPVTVVVVDNRGGHIFDDLPLAAAGVDAAVYRELWLTPPALDPVAVAAGFGVAATSVRNPDELAAAWSRGGAGPRLIHAVVAADGARATRARALAQLAAPATPTPPAAAARAAEATP